MNPSKNGLSCAGKAGAVVVLIVIVLGAAYLIPSLSKGGGTGSASSSSNLGEKQITGLLSLFGDFPRMQVAVDSYDAPDQVVQNLSLSYSVLGTGTLNSVQYTRVEFTTAGVGHDVVGWFNSTGGIDRLDVLGQTNYTGNGVANRPFLQIYTSTLGGLVATTDNSTLLSLLTKTSETTRSIGLIQMDVTSYQLVGRVSLYSSLTVEIGTIPGTDVQLAVYVNEKTTTGSTAFFDVTSLTR